MANSITLTDIGRQKLAGDIGSTNELTFSTAAVGSGTLAAGTIASATALANQQWSGSPNSVVVHGSDVIVTARVPETTGNYAISEAGIFDDDGDLIAYLSFDPAQNKADPDGNSPNTFTFTMTLGLSGSAQVAPSINPTGAVTHSELNTRLAQTQHIVPVGVILMWSGAIANIPSGWALCDGTNSTPDFRDKFVRGASDGANPGVTGGVDTATSSFTGSHNHSVSVTVQGHTLSISEMPAHQHGSSWAIRKNPHLAPYGYRGDGTQVGHGSGDLDNDNYEWLTEAIGGSQSHTHGATVSSGSAGTHAHSHDNRPAFYALAFIMKVAA